MNILISGIHNEPRVIKTGPGLTGEVNADKSVALRVGGRAAVSVAGGAATHVLTETQYSNNMIELTGAITGNVVVEVPLLAGTSWIIKNSTSGAFTVTVQGPTGSGIVVATGKTAILASDGTNVVRVTADNP